MRGGTSVTVQIEGDPSRAAQLVLDPALGECGRALPSLVTLGVPAELEQLRESCSAVPGQGCGRGHFAEKGAGFPQLQLCALTSSNIPSVFQILILHQPLLPNFSKGTHREQSVRHVALETTC